MNRRVLFLIVVSMFLGSSAHATNLKRTCELFGRTDSQFDLIKTHTFSISSTFGIDSRHLVTDPSPLNPDLLVEKTGEANEAPNPDHRSFYLLGHDANSDQFYVFASNDKSARGETLLTLDISHLYDGERSVQKKGLLLICFPYSD